MPLRWPPSRATTPNDAYTRNSPVPDYLDGIDAGIRGLRVGLLSDRVNADGVEPDIRDAVNAAVAHLGELGVEVEEISIPLLAVSAAISTTLIYTDATAVHRKGLEEYPEKYDHNNRVRLLTGAVIPAQAHHKANRLRQILRDQILEALERVDILVLPTSSVQATPIPTEAGMAKNGKHEFLNMLGGRRTYTTPSNLAGVPGLSINCGFTSDGLPVGLQTGRPRLRRGHPLPRRLRLRAVHRLAHPSARDLRQSALDKIRSMEEP